MLPQEQNEKLTLKNKDKNERKVNKSKKKEEI